MPVGGEPIENSFLEFLVLMILSRTSWRRVGSVDSGEIRACISKIETSGGR